MKLKLYRTLLLTLLFINAILNIYFIVMSVIHLIPAEVKDDYIMFIVCFVISTAFIVLEISNTFRSFKEGSSFVKPLMFEEDNSLNKKGFIIMSVIASIGLIALTLGILGMFNITIPGSSLPLGFYYLITSVGLIALINGGFSILFPFVGKEDKSFLKKIKKSEW